MPISGSLSDPQTVTLIRSCTLDDDPALSPKSDNVAENPKKEIALAAARLESEPACLSSGVATKEKVQSFMSDRQEENGNSEQAIALLRGIEEYFGAQDNCDERFVFAYYNDTVAGVYIGSHIGKGSVQSSLRALSDQIADRSSSSHVAEFCHANGTDPDHVFGISIESGRNLASVQKTLKEWSEGNCFVREEFTPTGALPGATLLRIPTSDNSTLSVNGPTLHRRSLHASAHSLDSYSSTKQHEAPLNKRATCSYLAVSKGDTCPTLVKKCGVTSSNFVKYNPKTNLCSSLESTPFVCCSAGDLPSTGVVAPTPGADGVCATHLIRHDDTCTTLAARYGVTVEDLEKWNKGKTWAWTVCDDMLLGYNLCVSDGFAPMPSSQQGVSPPK